VWSGGSEWGDAAVPAVRVLAVAQDVSSVAIAVVAVGLLVLGLRRTADPRRTAGGTGLAALAAVLLSGGTAVAMNVADPADAWAQFTGRPTFTAAYLVSVVVLVVVGASAVRTVRAARRREGATS
jgi:hypothetical protein